MPNNLRKNLSSITDTILICFVWVSCVYFWYFGMFFRVVKVNIFKPRFNFRYQTASCSATTRLERGATVYVQLVKGELFGHSYLFSTFTGYKLSWLTRNVQYRLSFLLCQMPRRRLDTNNKTECKFIKNERERGARSLAYCRNSFSSSSSNQHSPNFPVKYKTKVKHTRIISFDLTRMWRPISKAHIKRHQSCHIRVLTSICRQCSFYWATQIIEL